MAREPIELTHDTVKFDFIDGILECELQADEIDLNVAHAIVDGRKRRYNDQQLRCLIDVERVKNIDKDARDYLASSSATSGVVCAALYFSKPTLRVMANFFLHFSKPKIPIRAFNNKEDARKWLRSRGAED